MTQAMAHGTAQKSVHDAACVDMKSAKSGREDLPSGHHIVPLGGHQGAAVDPATGRTATGCDGAELQALPNDENGAELRVLMHGMHIDMRHAG